jgi:hypothetical protein
MRQRINEIAGFMMIIGFVCASIGVVLWIEDVVDISLTVLGALEFLLACGVFIITDAKNESGRVKFLRLHGKIVGVVLDVDGNPELVFENGHAMSYRISRMFFSEYFAYGDWPHNPFSGVRLKMVSIKELKDKDHEGRRIS